VLDTTATGTLAEITASEIAAFAVVPSDCNAGFSFSIAAAAIARAATYKIVFRTTMGSPRNASYGVYIATSRDLMSPVVSSPALGGQVTGVSFTIAAADRVPFATGKAVTVSFTMQTALAAGHSVTITWPSGYLTGGMSVTAFGFSAVTNPIGPLPSGHHGVQIAVTAALAAGPRTITLTGATIGGPISASSSGISVSTSTDQAGTCGYPAIGKDKVMSTVDVFDSASGVWSQATPLSSARFYLSSTSLLDIVLFAGGFNGLPPSGNVNIKLVSL